MWASPGPEQGPKSALPSSIEHSKLAPGSEEKVKVGVGSLVSPVGPVWIVVSGGVESIAATPQSG